MESSYAGSDAQRIWQGLQTIIDYKGKDSLNTFYAINTEPCMRVQMVPDYCVISISVADVSKTFKQVNIRKAAVPDEIPGHVLRASADHLVSVFTDMFNLFLTQSEIPIYFKPTTITQVSV